MVKGFYLVSENSNKQKEVELFKKSQGVDMELVHFEDIIPIAQDNFDGKILLKNGEVDCPDFVFVRALDLGDKDYHLKSVLDMFERLGVLCINSPSTRQIASDKLLTSQIVSRVSKSIKVPKTILITPDLEPSKIGEIISYPLVIKIMHGSKGRGISLIETEEELTNLLNILFAAPFNDQVLAQQTIESSKGRDLRIVVACGEIIDSFVRVNPNDFKSNIAKGGHVEKFKVPESLEEDVLKIAEELNLEFGSIDFLFGENEDEYYFCEANSTIGMSYLLKSDSDKLEKYSNLIKNFII